MNTTCPACSARLPSNGDAGLCWSCVARVSLRDPADATTIGTPAPAFTDVPVGARIGDYELLEVLGRGGMGVVYKARQTRLQRMVAIKTIVAEQTFLPETARRFHLEAESLAGLRHPHIVGIHELIAVESRMFIVMEYVPGGTLADHARRHPYSPADAARCVRKLAAAVHYAHQRGVLHRDLKPANVLLDEFGEPRLTDFGLAKRVGECSDKSAIRNPQSAIDLTLTGQVLGSPHFMAPEQIAARLGEIGPACDVYSLGAILYFLLAGHPPFEGATLQETLLKVTNAALPPPRRNGVTAPRDLETICLKCLEREPHRRYASAEALADDLDRFLWGEPTVARPLGPLPRLGRWARRRPALAALAVVSTLAILAIAASLFWADRRVRAREEIVRRNAYAVEIHLAQQAIEANNFQHAREILERWKPAARAPTEAREQEDLRGFEWFHLRYVCAQDDSVVLGTHDSSVVSLDFSPDGKWLASGSFQGDVKLWDLGRRREVAAMRHKSRVDALKFSPDSKWLASGGQDCLVRISDVPALHDVRPPLPTKWAVS